MFAIGIGVSLILSRRMSRPLRQIAEVAGEIAKGHWDRRISPTGSAEAVVMADAFNDMTRSLSHWHEEARQRAEQLQASYQRFRAVTLSVHDAIVSTDGNGAIVSGIRAPKRSSGCRKTRPLALMFSRCLRRRARTGMRRPCRTSPAMRRTRPTPRTIDGNGVPPTVLNSRSS